MTSAERAPLLGGYSSGSAAFAAHDFHVYGLISLIRSDLVVDAPFSSVAGVNDTNSARRGRTP